MDKSKSIPKLRFPEFKEHWDFKDGNRIFDSITDKSHNSDLPILAISQEFGAVPRELIDYKISVSEKSVSTYKIVRKGNFIISLRSFQGGIEYSEYDGICSPAYIILKSKIEIHDHFYKYYFKTDKYIKELNRKLEGIRDGKMISYAYFSEISVPFPSIPEQRKIALFLNSIDTKLQALKKKKGFLEQYKKGVMQKVFSKELKFKDEKGKAFPKWDKKLIKNITFKVDKKNKSKENLPIYSINNTLGFIPQSEQFEGLDSNDRGYDISLYKIIEKETFAYNPARINVGSIGYSGSEDRRVIVSSLYVCFKTNNEVYDPFLMYFFQSEQFKNSVLKKGEGGVRIYLFFENFSQIEINLPSIDEQRKIVSLFLALDKKLIALENEISLTESWKKGLLQKIFV